MEKKAITIAEQIEKLKNRGLQFDLGEAKQKEILLDIGYYRFGYYCHPFINKDLGRFNNGVKISDIMTLYYLDANLKHLLLKYINRIEINFRTKLIYYVSMKYKTNPIWFVDNKIMKAKFSNEFDKTYNKIFKTQNLMIQNHHKKYTNDKYAPVWKTFEYLTLGTIITTFSNIKDEKIKIKISKYYDVNDLKKFLSLMHTVRQVRNICAHGGVLFDYRLPKSINSVPEIIFNKEDRNSAAACIKVICFFIKKISENRHNDIEREVGTLFEKVNNHTIIKSIITDKMNYTF